MSQKPHLELRVEFYHDRIETYVDHGDHMVNPEIVSGFLRQMADQIDSPDTTLAAVILKHLRKAE